MVSTAVSFRPPSLLIRTPPPPPPALARRAAKEEAMDSSGTKVPRQNGERAHHLQAHSGARVLPIRRVRLLLGMMDVEEQVLVLWCRAAYRNLDYTLHV